MRIVVVHLTRMEKGYVCAAGVDLESQRQIRVLTEDGRLETAHLSLHGGPFDIGNVVDLRTPRPVPKAPHVEDHVVRVYWTRMLRRYPPQDFWRLLERMAKARLSDLFGDDLVHIGRSRYGTLEHQGRASLGVLRLNRNPELLLVHEQRYGELQIRLHFTDGSRPVDARVTDIRLYESDHVTPDVAKCRAVAERIKASKPIILSLGLTRAFAPSPDRPRVHWLQVNNIHLQDNPVWRLA